MRDLTEDFFLLEIETQGDLRMLQIVVATARIGFVCEQ